MESILITVFMGFVAGWLVGFIVEGPFGVLGDMVVGLMGAFVGAPLFVVMDFSLGEGLLDAVGSSGFGAVLLLLVFRLI